MRSFCSGATGHACELGSLWITRWLSTGASAGGCRCSTLDGVWHDLAAVQGGILTRQQALAHGLTEAAIAARLTTNRWQRLHPGVLATFSGPPNREAHLWAALLSA